MNSQWKKVWAVLVLGGLLAVTMVAAVDPQKAVRVSATADRTPYQAWLERQVRHELRMLPYYGVFDNLAFKTDGDRVILLGQVVRPSTRSDAEARVKGIEGVSAVVNRIEVLPLSPMDDRLRRALYRSIYSNGMLQRYALQPVPPIHIVVKNGQVALEGVVGSEAERNAAFITANGVPGAFSVTNHLQVER